MTALIITISLFIVLIAIVVIFLVKRNPGISGKEMIDTFSSIGALKTLLQEIDANQRQLTNNLQETQSEFNNRILDQNKRMQELLDMVGVGSKVQDNLHEHVQRTLQSIEAMRAETQAKDERDEGYRKAIQRLEEVIAGTKRKGMAGENILREVLKPLVASNMIATQYKINGKEVEFGFILSDKKILPIDSKWPSTELLDSLTKEEDELQRERTIRKIENELERRVSEVTEYIDPKITVPWAIAAVPDAVFNIARRTHFDAYRKNVILVSYSMALPFLLVFFSLYLQFSRSIDIQNLERYLIDIKRHIDKMDEILENKVKPAVTRMNNASDEYKQIIGNIRNNLVALESARPGQDNP